jgi:hypothetical protein
MLTPVARTQLVHVSTFDVLHICDLPAGIAVHDASSRDACLAVVLELLQAPEATAQLKPGAPMFAVLCACNCCIC